MEANLRALPVGQVLNDYRIEGILGQGGFGITYLATDTSLQIKVAIKEYFPREFAVRDRTLTIRASGNNEDRENFTWGLGRFLEEARILARFDHPNIVSVRRFFETNGTAYLVMDYCDGEPLDEIVKRDGTLSREQLERILPHLLDGLEQIHSNNYLHRDIKPANIYIRSNGTPVLLDFGAARQEIIGHSRSVTSLATDGYAALEQYSTRGKQGACTDVYGLGATLYRCVTGEKPQASADRILDDTLEPAASKASGRYSKSLLLAIDAAMGVRPEQRPQKVSQFRAMLEKNIAAPSPPAPKPLPPPTPPPTIAPDPKPVPVGPSAQGIVACFLLALLVVLFIYWEGPSQPTPTPAPTPTAINDPIKGADSAPPTNKGPGSVFRDCPDCPEMVVIPRGSFTMGSPRYEVDRYSDEGPQHAVTIPRQFAVGKFEITVNEWNACVIAKGCDRAQNISGTLPVSTVNWFDAQHYAEWLSKKTGKTYRLLTEAEWEYAARAGTSTAYSFGNSITTQQANHNNTLGRTVPVGSYPANDFGLHDMHGNVREWTEDCWNANYNGAPSDGSAWTTGDCGQRVLRGGSWLVSPRLLRSANRDWGPVGGRIDIGGFRVSRTL